MPVAFIPSPSREVWQLGPLPIRAYALCLVGGIVLGLWVASRRYLRAGGRPGIILDVATWAVPAGLAGGRLYSVITDYQLYSGPGHSWLEIGRIWDGGLGLPGAVAAGSLATWFACRRAGVSLAPVAGAAAPGVAFGLALGCWGDWFSQRLYGRPSGLPWAVEIAPAHRMPGYENYATFQPTVLYACCWDVLTGVVVIWAARRFLLSGDRTFAILLAACAMGRYGTESLRIDASHRLLGLRVDQLVMIAVFAGAVGYLYLSRARRDPDRVTGARVGLPRQAATPVAGVSPPAGDPVAGLPAADDGSLAAGDGRPQPESASVLPRPRRFGTRAERAGMQR
jgi:phosphatidylglycerol---prolipoprotein diacylglyceryl transferase